MFGMSPETMMRMALKLVDLDNPEQLAGIAQAIRETQFEPGEREKVRALLKVASEALEPAKVAA